MMPLAIIHLAATAGSVTAEVANPANTPGTIIIHHRGTRVSPISATPVRKHLAAKTPPTPIRASKTPLKKLEVM